MLDMIVSNYSARAVRRSIAAAFLASCFLSPLQAADDNLLPKVPTLVYKIDDLNNSKIISSNTSTETKDQQSENGIFQNTFDRIAQVAKDLLGTKYKFGGTSPTSGFDCSGFVSYVFKEGAELKLPRSSRDMKHLGKSVDLKSLKPGDLIFFSLNNSHVGIYIGNNKFIHAPRKGRSVSIDNVMGSFFQKNFVAARRVINSDMELN